ncbi:methyltransferase domain-containing protein [Treponema putidum]|uniref:Methyltransferase domain-containing protein n=1 Tax=Treponema putidum TaxID=221027 RepID=A0AAE9MSK0_9SPIR|nr:methyltransferase domain-containing protein [Treponema putidum]UTY31807.1 methyltransferase domain-containing protein [Treponema putidum]UTY34165.1 methyltransferase domain-containing protein [Treponema putidum]
MLDSKGFDLWSDNYDTQVEISDEENVYPFAGYKKVLSTVYEKVRKQNPKNILDIGFGTAILTKKLYDDGYNIYGIDFSNEMIKKAKQKMPNAELLQFDFTGGLPKEFEQKQFDVILSTYAIHHIDDDAKKSYILKLLKSLKPNGILIFGDVAFKTEEDMEAARKKDYGEWDDEEYYLIAARFNLWFPNLKTDFIKISYCSGVFTIYKE